ncbi:MAG: hypothetical protein PHE50_04905 [Dehalococcoidales bacterium]|nr:hypothetical protein [Dehalococcoidales bacterium]
MPITKQAFNKGMSPDEDSIIAFLNKDPNHAYSEEEITKSLGKDSTSLVHQLLFSLILARLVSNQHIKSKVIGGVTYYTSVIEKS